MSASSDAGFLLEVQDQVAVVTLSRPEIRNAISPAIIAALGQLVADLDRRDDVAATVLTGADPAFCAGLDLRQLSGEDEREPVTDRNLVPQWLGAFPPHVKPVIGAINGAAVTGGLELALGCDFLIASERARFADTHARVGVMPGMGMTIRLPELIGPDRARRLSLTGEFIDASRAYEWGLVTEVVPHAELLPRARELAATIASIPTEHVREIRSMYDEIGRLPSDDAWEREASWSRAWMRSRFDSGRLRSERASIIERGRTSI